MEAKQSNAMQWRLVGMNGTNQNTVHLIMDAQAKQNEPLTYATDIIIELNHATLTLSQLNDDLPWNDEDHALFKILLERIANQTGKHIQLNLNDPVIEDVIHILAANRFKTVRHDSYLLEPLALSHAVSETYHVGDFVTLNLINGFQPAIVVELAKDLVTCVVIGDEDWTNKISASFCHAVVCAAPCQLLPADYAAAYPDEDTYYH